MDKDIIILQDSTKRHIWYIKNEAARPEPHGNKQICTPDPHDSGPMVGDGNVSRGTGAAQTTIEIFTFAD